MYKQTKMAYLVHIWHPPFYNKQNYIMVTVQWPHMNHLDKWSETDREILCGLAVRALVRQTRGVGFESHRGKIPFSVSK